MLRSLEVNRLPDPEDLDHLATVTVQPGPGDPALFPAIERRLTERRRMSHRPMSAAHLRTLAEEACRVGAFLLTVTGAAMRQRLTAALTDAA